MEGLLRGGDGYGGAAVVRGCVALAEVIGLDLGVPGADLLLCVVSGLLLGYGMRGLLTQSISSRSSDSRIQVLTIPVPLAALILTSTRPKKM
jgi:hypothetical protein